MLSQSKKANPKVSPGIAKAKARAKSVVKAAGKAEATAKAQRGTAGTFAGRRPPACPVKRAIFEELKAHYLRMRVESVEAGEELSSGRKKKCRKKFTMRQIAYLSFMKKHMAELAKAGVDGAVRMQRADEAWKKHQKT